MINMRIVDLQGFKDANNNFIIKEFAILFNGVTQTFIIKPPYSYTSLSLEEKKQVRWLENNRGLFWSEGFIDYREFKRTIKPYLYNNIILTKGNEKVKWIEELCKNCNVKDIGENGCPNFFQLHSIYDNVHNSLNCVHHKKKCALKNVLCIKNGVRIMMLLCFRIRLNNNLIGHYSSLIIMYYVYLFL